MFQKMLQGGGGGDKDYYVCGDDNMPPYNSSKIIDIGFKPSVVFVYMTSIVPNDNAFGFGIYKDGVNNSYIHYGSTIINNGIGISIEDNGFKLTTGFGGNVSGVPIGYVAVK